ncbi:MAG: hypothetical protein A2821_02875 [Candidatus Magasanikbacteria bacterium RIFCSPHIGHO2_01_FULL_41_23]|uniref:Uncharacterized protein n=1 Tax=Candidatus Magasanikbacteria bacterium RIFCSPLOWO2_01_FULL_40_15 TaxID=1798686 RepID=A0A1F6N450_9BACT|nr:MAG: hypothetical protein A2821_02875 [Candidatus Magasanikbacteria bacterium RIFCSPHIGHO2_01_FULL_41_23]OGH67281.1 MAG: hypothetical protein A3C66_00890 [Candidatus Magasanikbacteria bacterium RIFCSPHIGHO2_02_FULL_41_35]OGH76506.1 MAG: hypothetical protein A3F22_00100 [Candidatus Magasanikbacteria bacterium RIFCSPHIGHO2_12_FULL_41_16]OGH78508.1 MAG: hypothetical protein A2983_03255 [Candidatus Magasanikbacteria bacterium RIFCSPLOWO2_01_FULL_40_15]
MPAEINQKKLVYRIIKNHDPEAYGQLYDLFVARIYRFIFFKVGSKEEAEDLTSDVFLKTWQYLTKNKSLEIKSFSGLIYQIARNALVDLYRAKANRQEFSLDLANEFIIDEEKFGAIDASHDVARILQALKKIKQEYQEVLVFKYIEELSIKEIAEILKKTPINVRVTLHRAMIVLKKSLKV